MFRDVEWFPLLPEEETEELLEVDSEEEGEDDVTESEPEIPVRTRGQRKHSAATPPASPATKEVVTKATASDSPKRKKESFADRRRAEIQVTEAGFNPGCWCRPNSSSGPGT